MANALRGMTGPDTFFSSESDDLIEQPQGVDWIDGRGGHESIPSGEVIYGARRDQIFGQEGVDYPLSDGHDKPRTIRDPCFDVLDW
ncbi:hypothetical protein RFM41_23065 [Mesorhizobium sp. VK25A]|uniref:Uncharacterized protein n=3 Tax=Mesorhizobium TaxID=68287 RepID=A0ABU5A845_9HYPH|nr:MULTISPECIES: hypothetical protein [unclassified Mesorhizobium]MDX8442890.1 hypothetical protein [Mesorhizobium sp. VK3E]MDX8443989.1 hypothetical protein [Mesorhizobium sp. VK3C]MDX8469908.1 hypothetical protein [Mesorhizobium sp. VK23B]MDX8476247.1 hypothetical protein [Mesorhizobium sp. VK23A]MDX8509899.1 hypothetical protein [Mesorhizobium sp. VK22E]